MLLMPLILTQMSGRPALKLRKNAAARPLNGGKHIALDT